MLKLEQNWGKIANYPPNAQQRSAPLISTIIGTGTKTKASKAASKALYIY